MRSFELSFVQARQTYDLAIAFVEELREWVTAQEFEEIRARNQTPAYAVSCATHDFIDSNAIMPFAFKKAIGREFRRASDAGEGRCTSDECAMDLTLWNAAWAFARSTGMI